MLSCFKESLFYGVHLVLNALLLSFSDSDTETGTETESGSESESYDEDIQPHKTTPTAGDTPHQHDYIHVYIPI